MSNHDLLDLRDQVQADTIKRMETTPAAKLLTDISQIGELNEYQRAITITAVFELAVRVKLAQAATGFIRQSSADRYLGDASAAMVSGWIDLYRHGWRAADGQIIPPREGGEEYEQLQMEF